MTNLKRKGISLGSKLMLVLTVVVLAATAFLFLRFGGALAEGMIKIDLGAGTQTDSDAWQMTDAGLRISKPGEYMISGTLENGQIWVDCAEKGKVFLYLDGAEIMNPTGPAIQIGDCSPRAVISLVDGTTSVLKNGTSLDLDAKEEPDGVIFSRSDLTIEGSGVLRIEAGAMNGIVSKDDIRVEGGEIVIEAPHHGIKGKDSVEISGGKITIHAGKDGIKSTNKKDKDRGYIDITGGEIIIACGDDPLSFITYCNITGGTINLTMTE